MSEFGEIDQRIEVARQSAVTTTGDAVVHITNYYYRETARVEESDRSDSEDDLPCPYRGLFHFEPQDARFFFGREGFVAELVAAVKTRNFVPILGASGSGKSSVVLAGLVPKLQREGHWRFTHFRPGNEPFHGLAMALVPLYAPDSDETDRIIQARKLAESLEKGDVPLTDVLAHIRHNYPNDRLLLIGDQFEELYTLCGDRAIRQRFLDRLLACLPSDSTHRSSIAFVMTMRVDFLGNALSYSRFGDVLQNRDIKLRAMNHEEFADAIVKPAETLGVTFAPGLVDRILAAVEKEPGNLPLLEFALTELWRQRSGKQLTHEAYEAIGEVEGALARHADASYDQLSEENRERVRRIFIQLVRPGEGAEDTRRLATKGDLSEEHWGLVKALADDRLVVTSRNGEGRETVEVVHEALIRHWGELRKWMEVDREFRVWQERLRMDLRQWEEAKRDDEALLRGVALDWAQKWWQERDADLGSGEREFIRQSVKLRDRQIEAEQQRKQAELERERQARRVAQRTTVGAVLAGLVMAGLTVMTGIQLRELEIREIQALNASSKALWASGNELDGLVESLKAGSTLRRSMWQNVRSTPGLKERTVGTLQEAVYGVRQRNQFSGVTAAQFSPDGSQLATRGEDGQVFLWDTQGNRIAELKGHQGKVWQVAYSPDSRQLATGGEDGRVFLWDTQGNRLAELKGHQGYVWQVAYSPDSRQLATRGEDGRVFLWDTQGNRIAELKGHQGEVWHVAYSPDGSQLATGGEDGRVFLWDTQGNRIAELKGHQGDVWQVAYSPDGSQLATRGEDGRVFLWEMKFEALMERGCNWVEGYLQGHPQVEAEGKAFCAEDSVGWAVFSRSSFAESFGTAHPTSFYLDYHSPSTM